jgi:uncharacterized linocin/CFP29 family protein
MDYLDRATAPISEAEWNRIDEAIISSARTTLVGRRVVEVLGPLGAGAYNIPFAVYKGKMVAGVDMTGEGESSVVEASNRKTVSLPQLYTDFKITWRDVETDRQMGLPLDVSAASIAAGSVAMQEDALIFNGSKELGLEGLFTAAGRSTVKIGNWDEPGSGLADAVKAVNQLAGAGHYGPYAMVMSPVQFGKLIRIYGNTGTLELDQIKALVTGGIYYSNAIGGQKAVLVEVGAKNLSLAIGQDFTAGYLGAEKMNHLFRVLETAALLIRRPSAICSLE